MTLTLTLTLTLTGTEEGQESLSICSAHISASLLIISPPHLLLFTTPSTLPNLSEFRNFVYSCTCVFIHFHLYLEMLFETLLYQNYVTIYFIYKCMSRFQILLNITHYAFVLFLFEKCKVKRDHSFFSPYCR